MRYGVHKIWPQSTALTLTFDLQNLIRQSIGDSDYFPYVSSRLLEWFMRYCGNCTTGMNEHSNETAWKRNAFADSVPKTWTSTSVRTDLYPHMKILLRAIYCNGVCGPHAGWFRTSGQQISQKMGDSLHWTPLVLSLAEKSVTEQTNKQTVNDISTPCLLACVDINPPINFSHNCAQQRPHSTSQPRLHT